MSAPVPASVQLRRIEDAMLEDIMSMSEEELRAEMIEDGLDPDAEIAKVNEIIRAALDKAVGR